MYWIYVNGAPVDTRETFKGAVARRGYFLDKGHHGSRVVIRDADGVTTCCESSSGCYCFDPEGYS